MKNLIFILLTVCSSMAFALPDGGVSCQNDRDVVGDGYMRVDIKAGMLDFTFHESAFGPIKATTAGTDVFTLVEEKVEFSGEGETWVEIYSAFMVYKPSMSELEVTFVRGEFSRTETLACVASY